MDYGWYAHVMHDCSTDRLRISGLRIPRCEKEHERKCEQTSVQANWMCEFVASCEANSKTVTKYSSMDKQFWSRYKQGEVKELWMAPHREKDLIKFIELSHDFSKVPSVNLTLQVGGILGRILQILRLFRSK